MICAGIDGGQTATKAVVVDAHGRVLGSGVAGPVDHLDDAAAEERLRSAVRGALDAALDNAGLERSVHLDGVVAGLSGFGGAEQIVASAISASRLRVMHDAPIALAGALDLQPGIVVIAGTGSVIYGEDGQGHSITLGGWGYLFGDEGSAFWIARRGIETALRAHEREGEAHPLGLAALAYFDASSLREIVKRFYHRRIEREAFAGFARLVSDAAYFGEPAACAILDEGAAALAELAIVAARRLNIERPAVATVGGAFESPELHRRFVDRIAAAMRSARVVAPLHDPATGAALLALRETGAAHNREAIG